MQAASDATPSRLNTGWLAPAERRAIAWLVPRLPLRLTPDGLTAIGFAGAVLVFLAYLLARFQPALLWVVDAGLLVNWFGDSLDGAVARARASERPRYGFFLDQATDLLAQFLCALGLGLSGYLRLEIAALGFAVFMMMTALTLIETAVTRVFLLAHGGIGLTEVRLIFVAFNALLFFLPPHPLAPFGGALTYADLLGGVWIVANLAAFLTTMAAGLRRLAREEPPAGPHPPGDAGD